VADRPGADLMPSHTPQSSMIEVNLLRGASLSRRVLLYLGWILASCLLSSHSADGIRFLLARERKWLPISSSFPYQRMGRIS